MVWILDALEDVRSDLSAYHRIDDLEGMEARRFLSYAQRLHLYSGAVRGYWVNHLSKEDDGAPVRPAPGFQVGQHVEVVEATPANLQHHPVLSWPGSYSQAPLAPE